MKDSSTAKDIPSTNFNYWCGQNLTAEEQTTTDELLLLRKILSELRQINKR